MPLFGGTPQKVAGVLLVSLLKPPKNDFRLTNLPPPPKPPAARAAAPAPHRLPGARSLQPLQRGRRPRAQLSEQILLAVGGVSSELSFPHSLGVLSGGLVSSPVFIYSPPPTQKKRRRKEWRHVAPCFGLPGLSSGIGQTPRQPEK